MPTATITKKEQVASTFTSPWVKNNVRRLVATLKNFLLVAGVFSLLAVTTITGMIFMFGFNPDDSAVTKVLIIGIALSLSIIKFTLWEKFSTGELNHLHGLKYGLPVICVAFMIIDFCLDVGFVTQWLYPEISNKTIFPSAEYRTFDWYLFSAAVGGISLFSEIILVWMLNNDEIVYSEPPRSQKGPEDVPIPISDWPKTPQEEVSML